jgi:hypothetical protein
MTAKTPKTKSQPTSSFRKIVTGRFQMFSKPFNSAASRAAAVVLSFLLAGAANAAETVTISPTPKVTGAAPFPPMRIAPPPKPIFDVRTYGATGDGKTYDTAAIQKAIDACAETHGSVVLAGGTFLTAPIRLKGHMTFYVAKDATLLATTRPEDYVITQPKEIVECDDCCFELKRLCRNLIYADKANGLHIDGGGTIDGQCKLLHITGNESKRPSILSIFQSKDVIVRNITLKNPRMWTQLYTWCDNLLLDHVNVDTGYAAGNLDGVDFNDCYDVTVRNCVIASEDDGICLKSQSPRGLKNFLIQNNRVAGGTGGIKIGTSTVGPIKNIQILDNTMLNSHYGGLNIQSVDGSAIKHVRVRNLDIVDSPGPIFIRLGDRTERRIEIKNHTTGPGSIEEVVIEDVRIISHRSKLLPASSITGIPGAKVRNITLKNIQVELPGGLNEIPKTPAECIEDYPICQMFGELPAYGFYVRHAENVKFENVSIGIVKSDARQWLISDDATVETKNCVDRGLIVPAKP